MAQYRQDNIIGVMLSMAVMAVTAMTLDSGPRNPCQSWPATRSDSWRYALTTFAIAALLTAFSSATGTLFGAGYLVPQAWGRETVFGDRIFRRVVEVLIVISVCSTSPLLEFTDMTPVRLSITMPVINGVIRLPITARPSHCFCQ